MEKGSRLKSSSLQSITCGHKFNQNVESETLPNSLQNQSVSIHPYTHTPLHQFILIYVHSYIYIHTHIHHTHTSIHTLSGCQVSNLPQRSGASGWTDWTVFFLVLYYMICIFDGDGRRLCVIKMTPMDGCGRHIKKGFPDIFFVFCSVDVVCICLC
jgi:hypothetical protein